VKDKNKILFYQKQSDQWLSGQWELPTFILETNDAKLKQYPKVKSKKQFTEALVIKTGITKYSIDNHLIEMSLLEFKKLTAKIEIEYIFKIHNEKLNLSTASIKALKKI
jgi:A/G-specific adenine glycosylase